MNFSTSKFMLELNILRQQQYGKVTRRQPPKYDEIKTKLSISIEQTEMIESLLKNNDEYQNFRIIS